MVNTTLAVTAAFLLSACTVQAQESFPGPMPTKSSPAPEILPSESEDVYVAEPSQSPSESPSADTINKMSSNDSSVYLSGDSTFYTTPWVPHSAGQIMIDYGCTNAPYYSSDPSCPDNPQTNSPQGKHHGVDLYYDCGTAVVTPFFAQRIGPEDAPNPPGNAYGADALRLRIYDQLEGVALQDIIIGHTNEQDDIPTGVWLEPGDSVTTIGEDGAPDGCHLHFETRPLNGSVHDAADPKPYLELQPLE